MPEKVFRRLFPHAAPSLRYAKNIFFLVCFEKKEIVMSLEKQCAIAASHLGIQIPRIPGDFRTLSE
jgi:hypothetical protein